MGTPNEAAGANAATALIDARNETAPKKETMVSRVYLNDCFQ